MTTTVSREPRRELTTPLLAWSPRSALGLREDILCATTPKKALSVRGKLPPDDARKLPRQSRKLRSTVNAIRVRAFSRWERVLTDKFAPERS
ncbi:hypothetical protein MTO96_044676 [Rhipicephalus appendiculatus]